MHDYSEELIDLDLDAWKIDHLPYLKARTEEDDREEGEALRKDLDALEEQRLKYPPGLLAGLNLRRKEEKEHTAREAGLASPDNQGFENKQRGEDGEVCA